MTGRPSHDSSGYCGRSAAPLTPPAPLWTASSVTQRGACQEKPNLAIEARWLGGVLKRPSAFFRTPTLLGSQPHCWKYDRGAFRRRLADSQSSVTHSPSKLTVLHVASCARQTAMATFLGFLAALFLHGLMRAGHTTRLRAKPPRYRHVSSFVAFQQIGVDVHRSKFCDRPSVSIS